MTTLLFSTFGFFYLHTGLWLVRGLVDAARGRRPAKRHRPAPAAEPGPVGGPADDGPDAAPGTEGATDTEDRR